MSSEAMIFTREITAAERRRGGDSTFVQHAVDAVAHDQPVLEWLDVDVGGARLQRLREDEVHEPDHRRLGSEVLQVLDIAPVLLVVARLDALDDGAHGRLAAAIQPLERRVDLVGRRDVGTHALARGHLHRRDHERIRRIGDRERQLVFVLTQRHRLRVAQELGREPFFHERQLGEVRRQRERQVQLVGQRVREVAARDHAQAHQHHADFLARLATLLQLEGSLQVGGVELAALDQDFAYSFRQSDGGMKLRG
jgi:hypothetical protein